MDFIVRPKNEGLGFQLEAVSEVIKLEFEQRKLQAEWVITSPPVGFYATAFEME
jgi:hypothetical protein